MFLHTVLFWLRSDLSPAQIADFEAGVRRLMGIATVRFRFLGTPADTDRPVIDCTYSYKLVVGFDDRTGHDVYQDIDVHLDFVRRFSSYWTKVQIYDGNEVT